MLSISSQHFYVIWSLKEAFIKAIGLGLGYNLGDINFSVRYSDAYRNGLNLLSGTAQAAIKGVQRPDWRFDIFSLDDNHVVSVALGPTPEVIQSYREYAWAAPSKPLSPHADAVDSCELTSESPGYYEILRGAFPPVERKEILDLVSSRNLNEWETISKSIRIQRELANEESDHTGGCGRICASVCNES